MSSKIDVVIPARNEERTIKYILHMMNMHHSIGNIIVSIDGDTTDSTVSIARLFHTTVVQDNVMGKGQVVKAGLAQVTTPFVMFCDADYRGLNYNHLDTMTANLDKQFTRIGVPDYPDDVPDRVIASWPWVSGLRVVPTELVKDLDLHGYLMETQINMATYKAGKRFRFRFLPGLVAPYIMSYKRIAEMHRDREWGSEHGVF